MFKASVSRWNLTDLPYVRQLPLLQLVREFYPFSTLEGTYVLAAQHLLETSTVLFNNLFGLGLGARNFSVIGKCYSTNPVVYSELKEIKGLDVCSSSLKFFPELSFDLQYKENVRAFLKTRIEKILESKCEKLLVLDDGGELIHAVNQAKKAKILAADIEVVGVEQTSSGFAKLQTICLDFPIINIARSDAKLQIESHLIADAVLKNLWIALTEIGCQPAKALVIGKGAIGSKIQEKLSSYCAVDSYDLLKERSTISDFKKSNFKHYNLIVGCSGNEVLAPIDIRFLCEGVVLVSASSSDREFSGVTFRSAQTGPLRNCHEHVNYNGIYLLNCGFPINFSKHYELVDNEMYQLTRSLLLAGILQACWSRTNLSTSFIDLDAIVQDRIRRKFFSLYPYFAASHSRKLA